MSPRRRRGKKRRTCSREGCYRTINSGRDSYDACSYLCDLAIRELAKAQRLCEAGDGDTEHWLAAVALNDALSDYYRSDSRIYNQALEAGFTDEEWNAIKHRPVARLRET